MSDIIPTSSLSEADTAREMEEFQASLKKLERRDWWLWWTAVIIILLLTLAVVSMTVPTLVGAPDRFFQFNLSQSVRALVGLVLVFNIYAIYQQILIKRMRRQMAANVNLMIQMRTQADQFRKLAVFDPLTGLHNRRNAEQRLASEISRANRYTQPLAVLMLDLNGFKEINDHYGHAAGDFVLREFAERLKSAIRGSDVAMRMGGDEFVILLPGTRPEEVPYLLRRLQKIQVVVHDKTIEVTFSAGSAGYTAGDTPAAMLERADQALYAEKRALKSPKNSDSP